MEAKTTRKNSQWHTQINRDLLFGKIYQLNATIEDGNKGPVFESS